MQNNVLSEEITLLGDRVGDVIMAYLHPKEKALSHSDVLDVKAKLINRFTYFAKGKERDIHLTLVEKDSWVVQREFPYSPANLRIVYDVFNPKLNYSLVLYIDISIGVVKPGVMNITLTPAPPRWGIDATLTFVTLCNSVLTLLEQK